MNVRFKKSAVRTARFEWTPPLVQIVADFLGPIDHDPEILQTTAAAVKCLSDDFIHTRHDGDDSGRPATHPVYGSNPQLRKAYTLYYLLANVPKIVEILESAPLNHNEVSSVMDLGSGPGTALIGLLITRHRAGVKAPLSMTAIDHSADFLGMAKDLIRGFRNALKIDGSDRFLTRDLAMVTQPSSLSNSAGQGSGVLSRITEAGAFDLVMTTNVLVELPDQAIQAFPHALNEWLREDGYVLFMEPAQRYPGRRLLMLRDNLCASGWMNIYPCPGNYRCPALERKRDWCHHRLSWLPPKLVEDIDGLTGMHKNLLNFSAQVFRKPAVLASEPSEKPALVDSEQSNGSVDGVLGDKIDITVLFYTHAGDWRVVSEVMPQKGRYEVFVCGDFNGETHLLTAVLEKKRVTRYNKAFLNLARYDRIRLDAFEIRGKRLLVKENSRLTVIVDDGDQE